MDTTQADNAAWEAYRKLARTVRTMERDLPSDESKTHARDPRLTRESGCGFSSSAICGP